MNNKNNKEYMYYTTVKEIESNLSEGRKIIRVEQENNWVVIILDTGLKVKIRKF